jgi:hypothetical protein
MTAAEVLAHAGFTGKRGKTGVDLCTRLQNVREAPGALDAAAYTLAWLEGTARLPGVIPAKARDCADLLAQMVSALGHASIDTFAAWIRAELRERRVRAR